MNSFISKLLDRHANTEGNVKPVVRPRFKIANDLPGITEYEIEPAQPEDEMSQTRSSLERREWKSREDKNRIDKTPDTVNEPGIKPSQDPLFIAGPITVKRTGHEEQSGSARIAVDPVEYLQKETGVKKPSSIAPDENPGDTRNVIEKISLLAPVYRKQTGVDTSDEMISPNATPDLEKQRNAFLTDETDKQSAIFPLSAKIKSDNRFTGSEKGEDARPVINVTIGTIEVKANLPAVESRHVTKKEPPGMLSLEQYLEQTKPGRR